MEDRAVPACRWLQWIADVQLQRQHPRSPDPARTWPLQGGHSSIPQPFSLLNPPESWILLKQKGGCSLGPESCTAQQKEGELSAQASGFQPGSDIPCTGLGDSSSPNGDKVG